MLGLVCFQATVHDWQQQLKQQHQRSGLLVCELCGADVTAAGVVATVAVEPDFEATVFLASADCFDVVDVGGTVVLQRNKKKSKLEINPRLSKTVAENWVSKVVLILKPLHSWLSLSFLRIKLFCFSRQKAEIFAPV